MDSEAINDAVIALVSLDHEDRPGVFPLAENLWALIVDQGLERPSQLALLAQHMGWPA